jgi:multimeric flavodoxin WrbA
MDAADQMDQVYEALVHWADVVIVASPIRWGTASSLYFKMAERLNCVQNAITIRNNVLIRNKVAGFIIVGGQDNIQAVAGQMLGFFAELGFIFPQFPYIAHSRGWSSRLRRGAHLDRPRRAQGACARNGTGGTCRNERLKLGAALAVATVVEKGGPYEPSRRSLDPRPLCRVRARRHRHHHCRGCARHRMAA